MKPIVLSALISFALPISAVRADEKPPVEHKPLDASFLRLYAETRGFMLGRPTKPKPTPDGKAVLFLRSEAKKAEAEPVRIRCRHRQDEGTADARGCAERGRGEPVAGRESPPRTHAHQRRRLHRLSVDRRRQAHPAEPVREALHLRSRNRQGNGTHNRQGNAARSQVQPGRNQGRVCSRSRTFTFTTWRRTRKRRSPRAGRPKRTHGLAEFVAQEEMGRFSGYWWSPDSKFIAYEEADHEGVEVWYVADPAKPDQRTAASILSAARQEECVRALGIVPDHRRRDGLGRVGSQEV